MIRRTFGFKKDSDSISLSQICSGITTRSGEVLDRGTGLSKPTVTLVLTSLVEKNILVRRRNSSKEKGNEPTTYALCVVETPLSEIRTRGVLRAGQGGASPHFGQALVPTPDKGLSGLADTQDTVLQDTVNNVNVRHLKKGDVDNFQERRLPSVDDLATAMVLAQDIFEVFGDRKSREFYNYAAIKLVDHEQDVRFLLSTIKQEVVRNPNSKVQNPTALFVTQLKQLPQDRGVDL